MRRRNLLINSGGNSVNGHEYVEIGGVKWAKTNIGAESETDYGLYFQWGDTAGYTSGQCGSSGTTYAKPFNWNDYKFGNGTGNDNASAITKYNMNSDSKTVLDACDDAAVLHWGADWRMPTTEEFIALGEAVNSAWTSSYNSSGVAGLVLTDKNDDSKTLFFPAAGGCTNGSTLLIGSIGYYWASSLKTNYLSFTHSYTLNFNNSMVLWQNGYPRSFGLVIRPLLDI